MIFLPWANDAAITSRKLLIQRVNKSQERLEGTVRALAVNSNFGRNIHVQPNFSDIIAHHFRNL
jgi:hypothetical protein